MMLSAVVALMGLGCGDDDGASDAGAGSDAVTVDSGGASDSGGTDAGPGGDAGADAGPATDAGPGVDGGPAFDGGPRFDGGPDTGATSCGGRGGVMCTSRSEFCLYNRGCGFDDGPGVCTAIPMACDRVFAPVCGCDGMTYGNECMAHMAGVSAMSDGECESAACGGRTGVTCPRGQFCDYDLTAMCGRADAPGTCTEIPMMCADIFRPVCGCDGMDYGNACEAASASVSVLSMGTCE